MIVSKTARAVENDSPSGLPIGVVGFVAVVTAVRLLFAAAIPLTEDEAYYRLWSQHLQIGYYDHPPMVAWWMRAGRDLVGDTPLGARLAAVMGAALTSLLVFDIARLAGYSTRTCGRALVWYTAAPLIGVGSILMIPDAPASLFWAATLWSLLKAESGGRRAWWLLAGVAAGAAALSKYSALFLAPGVLLWLLRSPPGWERLKTPWPWAAAVVAGLLFLTNVHWNSTHHWLTFDKQFGRVAPHGFQPWRLATFLAALLLLVNPLITPFLYRGLKRGFGLMPRRIDDLILISGLPFFAYLCLHAMHAAVQAHWPAPLYAAIAIMAAVGAQDILEGRLARVAAFAPWFGTALSILALVHLALPSTDLLGPRDPSSPLRGWPAFAGELESLRIKAGARWIGAVSFGTAAQLINADRGATPILQITERNRYGFAPPPAPGDLAGAGLIVDLSRRMDTARLQTCFSDIRMIATLDRGHAGGPRSRYTIVRVSGQRRDVAVRGCQSYHNGRADD